MTTSLRQRLHDLFGPVQSDPIQASDIIIEELTNFFTG